MTIGSLVDAEYSVLKGMSKEELHDYLLDFGYSEKEVDRYMEKDAHYIFNF